MYIIPVSLSLTHSLHEDKWNVMFIFSINSLMAKAPAWGVSFVFAINVVADADVWVDDYDNDEDGDRKE